MIQSMTGFGDARGDVGSLSLAIEIKSLNNRFFKPVIRLPDALSAAEPEVESLLRRRVGRGSVYVTVKLVDDESASSTPRIEIDEALVRHLAEKFRVLGLPIDTHAVLSVPGVIRSADPGEEADGGLLSTDDRQTLVRLVDAAIDRLIEGRRVEGDGAGA